MNLPGDFLKTEARVELLTDGVLIERFDLGDLHALLAEKIDRMFEQRAAKAMPLMSGINGEVGNPADSARGIEARGDVADDMAVIAFGDKDAVGLKTTIIDDRLRFAPGPAAFSERAKKLFHIAIDGDGAECLRGDFPQTGKVIGPIGADGVAGVGVGVHGITAHSHLTVIVPLSYDSE